MRLYMVKAGADVLLGQALDLSLNQGPLHPQRSLIDPMGVTVIQMMQQPTLAGQPPQAVSGFKLMKLPTSEIFFDSVVWVGEVPPSANEYVTYFQVLDALEKGRKADLKLVQ